MCSHPIFPGASLTFRCAFDMWANQPARAHTEGKVTHKNQIIGALFFRVLRLLAAVCVCVCVVCFVIPQSILDVSLHPFRMINWAHPPGPQRWKVS